MKHLKRKHLFLLLLVLLLSCNKKELDSQKSLKFKHYVELLKQNVPNNYECAEQLFKYAQTDYEKSYANYIMGDIMYKESKYKMSVDYFEAAKKYGKSLDSIDLKRYYTNGLVYSYRRAGLIEQSNEAWELGKKLNKYSKDKYTNAEYYYNLSKLYDIDEDYCKSAEAKLQYLRLVPKEIYKVNPNYIFGVYSQLAFVQIKCGKLEEGEKSLRKSFNLVQDQGMLKNYSLYELYILSRALLAVNSQNINLAKTLFTEAYNSANNHKSLLLKKLILSERLEANIDTHENQIAFLKEVDKISHIEQESTKTLTKYET